MKCRECSRQDGARRCRIEKILRMKREEKDLNALLWMTHWKSKSSLFDFHQSSITCWFDHYIFYSSKSITFLITEILSEILNWEDLVPYWFETCLKFTPLKYLQITISSITHLSYLAILFILEVKEYISNYFKCFQE